MANDKDFFEEERPMEDAQDQTQEEIEKIKLGEKEYSQDELNELVELGGIAKESEEKFGRSIKKYWPEFNREHQENIELRNKLSEYERAILQSQQQARSTSQNQGELSPEEVRARALQEADNLGLIHTGNVRQVVEDVIQSYRLMDETREVLSKAEREGKPQASMDEIFEYMNQNGIRNPDKAYKLMFEDELDKWKQDQLKGLRQPQMSTQDQSTAGSKQPPPPSPITPDSLQSAVSAYLRKGSGQQ